MQRSLLVIILLSSILSTVAECDFRFHPDTEIYPEASRNRGAVVSAVEAVDAVSPEDCARSCCNQLSGRCNFVEYNTRVETKRCLLFDCRPIELCVTKNSSAGVNVVIVNRTVSTTPATTSARPQLAVVHQILVTTDKKVILETTKAPPNITSIPSSLTSTPTGLTNTITTNLTITLANFTTSSAGKPVSTSTLPPAVRQTLGTIIEILASLPDNQETTTKTIKPVSSSLPPKLPFPYVINLDAEKNKSSVGKKGVANPPIEDDTAYSNQSSNATTTITTQSTQADRHTTSSNLSSSINSDNVTSTTFPSTERVTVEINGTTTQSSVIHNITDINGTEDARRKAEEDAAEQAAKERRVRVGIHLVVALVVGLLLLLTVVGLVLRRVLDVWQRRHYQRMDFLVEGMYNNAV